MKARRELSRSNRVATEVTDTPDSSGNCKGFTYEAIQTGKRKAAQLSTMAPGWPGCFNCKGRRGCPRASDNAVRCTADECKRALTAKRAAEKAAAPQPVASLAAVGEDAHEEMPETMWVHELQEILGERACVVRKLSKVQLKCGPRSAARQQFLVRGTFLMDVEDGDEEEDDTPDPNTYWVHQADLLETIAVEDVEEALEARQEAVMDGLRPPKKARK